MKGSSLIAIVCVATLLLGANADIPNDKVTNFTNYTDLSTAPFTLYSGLLNISDSQYNKSIHYVFSTAFNNSATAPVVLWLNGGPGCSSLGGWLTEIGPYLFFNDSQVHNNTNYTWNSIANLLYLESPVGVGFSVGNTSYNDTATTQDQYAALDLFFRGFSEFKNNSFYISGESYAGVYVPNLAAYILKNASSGINLKGILVGNPVTNTSYLNTGFPTIEFFYAHYLIPSDAYAGFAANCQGPQESQTEPVCVFYTNIINSLTSNINPYGIYNYCYYSASDPAASHSANKAPWYKFKRDGNSPCTTTYGAWLLLNNATVQEQLHVSNLNVTWNDCNDDIFAVYNSSSNGSMDAYNYLLTQNISIWLFSGDTDSVVPFTDTLYWIKNINLNITEYWRAWAVNGQIGGFTQGYDGLRFVSVRGAGHMVPTDKPDSAYVLFQSFLNGTALPTPPIYSRTKSSI